MKQKTLELKATTTTDLGEFTAIAAAYSVDRMNERIVPGAFASTIAAWQGSGKKIPLHWDHSADPADIIGTVDPSNIRETKDGLEVSGKLDLAESEVAREAWRLMKNEAASLSFGYLVTDQAEADDGVMELKSIDLFEITITPAPANADTRVLSMKNFPLSELERLVREGQAILDAHKATEPETPDDQGATEEEPEGPTPEAQDQIGREMELAWLEAMTT